MDRKITPREGQIRRTDLNLRAKYIDVTTTIYRISSDEYQVHCEIDEEYFEVVLADFERSIKPVTLPITLVDHKPVDFEYVVPQMADRDIPKNFEGMMMTATDLYNLLLAKFPSINLYKLDDGRGKISLHLYSHYEKTDMGQTRRYISPSEEKELTDFLSGMALGIEIEIIEDQLNEPPQLDPEMIYNQISHINANKLVMPVVPEYSQRDEALWFDQVEGMFEGTFKKKDLYFITEDDYCCFVDFTTGGNIDIRNFLLLYKTVFITPPYDVTMPQWLKEINIMEDEFLFLIENGRIKLLLTQHEQRYQDNGFFKACYLLNPCAIITRRAIAALQQIDLIEIADNYIFNQNTDFRQLKLLAEMSQPYTKTDARTFYDMITWPIRAKRNSFELLNRSGTFAIPNFGVNNFAAQQLKTITGRDLDFEFTISANSIHIAHALNGTYFPYKTKDGFSDNFYAHLMGIHLNMFKTTTNTFALEENGRLPDFLNVPLNPIEVFDVNSYIPLQEFEEVLTETGFYPKGRQLMEHLSSLSPQERTDKISFYNQRIEKHLKNKRRGKNALALAGDAVLDGVGYLSNFGLVGSVYSLLKISGNSLAKNVPELRKIKEKINDMIHNSADEKNIHFLTQINRVARVKRS